MELTQLTNALHAQPDLEHQLAVGLRALDERYRDALDAFAPASRLFERRRIIAVLPNPRELAFVIGCLSEGENEAALIFDVLAEVLAHNAEAPIEHLVDEAWYYLRTSIDVEWQLDDEPPSVAAAIVYVAEVLDARVARLRAVPSAPPAAESVDVAAQHRLRALRSAFSQVRDASLTPSETCAR